MSNDMLDFSVSRSRLFEQVADRIEQLLISESLKPGDRLPSERKLAERLGVSRTVIREATRVLAVRGLAEIRPGSGTYVKNPTPEGIAEPIERLLRFRGQTGNFEKLHEIRRTLEIEIAGIAAERADEHHIAALSAALDLQIQHQHDADLFTKHDLEFHAALAVATGNELFTLLLTPISDLLLEFRRAAYVHDRAGAVDGGINHHRVILEHVREHDAEGARAMMREHLQQAEDLYWAEQRQRSPKST